MLKITLEQWRMFKAVADHGGFNQAASMIHKSQSSIHSSVHKIEDVLGVKLFELEGRNLVLTESGKMMLRRAEYLLEEASKVEAIGNTLAQGVESSLRIAIDEAYPEQLLYKALDNTSIQFPMVNIELMETVLGGSSELIQNNQVDIAVSPYGVDNMFMEELCQIKFIAVAVPHHALLTKKRELQLEDLMAHRQIVVRDSAMSDEHDEGWLSANQRWTVSHVKTSIDMVCNGSGFAWLPECMVADKIEQGKLTPLPLARGWSRVMPLYVLFQDADRLGPVARIFLAELRQQSLNLE